MTSKLASALLACAFASAAWGGGAAAATAGAAAGRRARGAARGAPSAPVGGPPTQAATTGLGEAMAPLREALAALVSNQDDLQRRQLALAQELQRWSDVLIESTRGAQREETSALAARLRDLEAALAAQDARHREVEQLVQRALDHTADRLEQVLQGVAAGAAPAPEAPPPGVAPGGGGARRGGGAPPPEVGRGGGPAGGRVRGPPAEPGGRGAGVVPATDGVPPGENSTGRWDRRGARLWWWGGVALLATGVGFVCLRRWHRSAGEVAPRLPRPTTGREPGHERAEAPSAGVAGDPDVQEIWAAAALLGEAVGRLRDGNGAAAEANGPSSPADAEDWVVLDDDLLTANAAAPAPPPAPLAEHPRAAPAPTTCRLRTADPQRAPAAVLRVLQHDPRVLRRPEPAVRCSDDTLEVSFRLLPGLSAGEQSHVEQRLRDACSGRGA